MINTDNQPKANAHRPQDQAQLDDRGLIQQFIEGVVHGQPTILSNPKLRVDLVFEEVHLLSHRDGMIARVKLDAPQAGFDVRESSSYRSLIQELLIPHDIFPVGKSTTVGFARYEYRTVPEGYSLQYTEAGVLWKDRWSRGKRRSLAAGGAMSGLDAMILHRGTWYPIQSTTAANGFVVIRTLGDETTLSASDFIVWLKKEVPATQNNEPETPLHRFGARMSSVSNSPTRILTGPPTSTSKSSSTPSYAEEIAEDEDSTILQFNTRDSYFTQNDEVSLGTTHQVETDDEPTILQASPREQPHPTAESLPSLPPPNHPEESAPIPTQPTYAQQQYQPQPTYTYQAPAQPAYEYPSAPIPEPEYHMDANAQMALTYLQSSLAYLLQVENKTQQVHAAIRATSMAIQNLLSLLNS